MTSAPNTNGMFRRMLKLIIASAGLVLAFCLGGILGVENFEPKVVYKTEYKTIPEMVLIPQPIYYKVEKEVEKVVYQSIYPRLFESVEQFRAWYEDNKPGILINADPKRNDCDDYAEYLQRRALRQGYLLSSQLVEDGKLYGVKVSEDGYHMGNLPMTKDAIYYVEPHPKKFAIIQSCR